MNRRKIIMVCVVQLVVVIINQITGKVSSSNMATLSHNIQLSATFNLP